MHQVMKVCVEPWSQQFAFYALRMLLKRTVLAELFLHHIKRVYFSCVRKFKIILEICVMYVSHASNYLEPT